MKRRWGLAVVASSFVVFGLACVDLFHGTDFETLCARSPDDPQCSGDSGTTPDVIEAGVDAARPHPDFCAWSSSEARNQALRACAWLGACEGPVGESAFGSCVVRAQLAFDCNATPSWRPHGAVDAFWGCLATVKSCGDVDGCVFPAGVQECIAVPSGSSTACGTLPGNASTRLKCAGPAGRAAAIEPCAMLGKTCTSETPSVASCSGPLGFKCTTSGCSGTELVDCRAAGTQMLDHGVDCALYGGGLCLDGDGGGPICQAGPEAPACTVDGPPQCDVDSVAVCIGRKQIRIDCKRVGLHCDVSQSVDVYDPTAACFNRGADACIAADKCVGTRLQSCGRGALYEVDCASVGLGECKIDSSDKASCTAP